jgi:hypothetical protein
MSMHSGFTLLKPNQKKIIFDKLRNKKGIAYYREGSFSHEIIWQDRKFIFPMNNSKKMAEGMWVFRSVMNDVRAYLENRRIRAKERLPVNRWNNKLENYRGKITATDVDHAYWRIAYLEGIISKRTYEKGLLIKDKTLRLAALANLASSKEYKVIKDGVFTNQTKVLKYNPILQKVYHNIRFTCFEHMNTIANLLGDDFICYKTDCIYYKDGVVNRMKVQTYLDSADLMWKQLVEPERPTKEDD